MQAAPASATQWGGSFRLLSFTVAMARESLTDELWMYGWRVRSGAEGNEGEGVRSKWVSNKWLLN